MEEVIMPALGMAQDTGKVIKWLKSEGDVVSVGEALIEVETDKAAVEVEAVANGILANVTANEGDIVPVGQRIALILQPGETVDDPKAITSRESETQPTNRSPQPIPVDAGPRVLASPKARRLAVERGIDLTALGTAGSGPFLTASDVVAASGQPAATRATGSSWRSMAENTTRAWQSIPHIFLGRDLNAEGLIARYNTEKIAIRDLTLTDLLLEAVARALVLHPSVNAGKNSVNLGLAVALDDGLIVPVIPDAQQVTLAHLAELRNALVGRARSQRLKSRDLANPTFTVSNLGMHGVDFFTAIISEGQTGILAVGAIKDRVVPISGQVAIRPMLSVMLSCDHRAVDGARGARFLETLAGLIEQPQSAG